MRQWRSLRLSLLSFLTVTFLSHLFNCCRRDSSGQVNTESSVQKYDCSESSPVTRKAVVFKGEHSHFKGRVRLSVTGLWDLLRNFPSHTNTNKREANLSSINRLGIKIYCSSAGAVHLLSVQLWAFTFLGFYQEATLTQDLLSPSVKPVLPSHRMKLVVVGTMKIHSPVTAPFPRCRQPAGLAACGSAEWDWSCFETQVGRVRGSFFMWNDDVGPRQAPGL